MGDPVYIYILSFITVSSNTSLYDHKLLSMLV